MELVAWAGLALGLLCFSVSAAPVVAPPRLYAAPGAWPTPDQITAYATAITGAILSIANAAFIVWHKLHPEPKKPRKPRKRKATEEKTDATKPT